MEGQERRRDEKKKTRGKCVGVGGYRMVERERRGDGSGGNERNVSGGGLAVPQASGGTTEER